MTEVFLTPEQMQGAHAYIGGEHVQLADLLQNLTPGRVVKLPVLPETVFHLESSWRLLEQNGFKPELLPPKGLDARAQDYLNEFRHAFLKTEQPGRRYTSSGFEDRMSLLHHGTLAFFGFGPGPIIEPKPMPSVVLLGACGSRYAGEVARLGGVLMGLNRDFGTVHATILSRQPDHTRRLIAGLETPVELTVVPCGHRQVRQEIPHGDGVVLAGKLLAGTARDLSMHLKAVRLAAYWGKPFIMRDVEVEPAQSKMSGWIVRQLALHAAALTVRTPASARVPQLEGITVKTGHDPAFDYLQQRPAKLSKLRAPERRLVDQLLINTEGRQLVGLNFHSFGPEYDATTQGSAYERQDRFFEDFGQTITRLAQASIKPVTFVFIPMNPFPSADSDLEAAYRLHRLVGTKVDLRVFEGDPAVDGLLYVLRRMHALVSTRYFGCVFGTSQNIPTLGIDCTPEPGGPVEQLFATLGQNDRVCRLSDFHTAWFEDALSKALISDQHPDQTENVNQNA